MHGHTPHLMGDKEDSISQKGKKKISQQNQFAIWEQKEFIAISYTVYQNKYQMH